MLEEKQSAKHQSIVVVSQFARNADCSKQAGSRQDPSAKKSKQQQAQEEQQVEQEARSGRKMNVKQIEKRRPR